MSEFDDIQHLPAVVKLLNEGYRYTAMYPYMDQYGVAVLYWKLRLDHPSRGKWIRPVHRTIGDTYELNEPVHIKDSILKPLYNQHLPAKFPDARIWLVEGEKCANRLNDFFAINGVAEQHIALTSGSATSADKADLTCLYTKKVTIWPDHDAEGQRYAEILCQRLICQVISINILSVDVLGLSKKEDCVDWFAKNPDATIERILSLPSVPPPEPKLEVELINMGDLEMKPVNWLWPDRIACGKVTLIAGNPGLGKSQITAMLAAHVTKGIAWPDLPDTPITTGSVVFLSAEDDPADTILPRLKETTLIIQTRLLNT